MPLVAGLLSAALVAGDSPVPDKQSAGEDCRAGFAGAFAQPDGIAIP